MAFPRVNARVQGIAHDSRNGFGWLAYLQPIAQATDSAQTLSAAAIDGGLYLRQGMTAARIDTSDTAVNIIAALEGMDIGDTYLFAVSVTTAFLWTIAAGAGVTLAGKTTVPASGFGFFLITRTAAATVTITGL